MCYYNGTNKRKRKTTPRRSCIENTVRIYFTVRGISEMHQKQNQLT